MVMMNPRKRAKLMLIVRTAYLLLYCVIVSGLSWIMMLYAGVSYNWFGDGSAVRVAPPTLKIMVVISSLLGASCINTLLVLRKKGVYTPFVRRRLAIGILLFVITCLYTILSMSYQVVLYWIICTVWALYLLNIRRLMLGERDHLYKYEIVTIFCALSLTVYYIYITNVAACIIKTDYIDYYLVYHRWY